MGNYMPAHRAFLRFTTVLFLASMLLACPRSKPDPGLLWVLPDSSELDNLKPAGEPQQFKGEDLFKHLNGGAEIYLKAGFKNAPCYGGKE